jgi:hypothetical protein
MIRVYYLMRHGGLTLGYTGIVEAEWLVGQYPELTYEGRL